MLFWVLLLTLLLISYVFVFRVLDKKHFLYSLLFLPFPIILYLILGTPDPDKTRGLHEHSIEDLLLQTEQVLVERPDDIQGWFLLARIYDRLGRIEDRDRALKQLERLRQE